MLKKPLNGHVITKIRVVLDTNILLSALISPHGTSNVIYRAWRAAKFDLITSAIQLNELRRASRYPKFKAILQSARVGTMINNLQNAIILNHLTVDAEADDPNDAFLISMSIVGNADFFSDRRPSLWFIATKKYQTYTHFNAKRFLLRNASLIAEHFTVEKNNFYTFLQ